MACQYLGGTIFPSQPLIMVKEGSNKIWNCGDTLPVKLSTNFSVLAWIGYSPKYNPVVISLFICQHFDLEIIDELKHTQGRIVGASALGWNLPWIY